MLKTTFTIILLFSIGAAQAQLKEFEVKEMKPPETPVVQASTDYPDNAMVLVYSDKPELDFRSSIGGINQQRYNRGANRYELLISPQKQILFVQHKGFIEGRLAKVNLTSKEVAVYQVWPKADTQKTTTKENSLTKAEGYKKKGDAKFDLEDYEGAIEAYNKALEVNPDYAEVYNNRANVNGHLEDYRVAIADYNEAIKLNPDHAIAYFNRGLAKGRLEDYRGAIADYNKALEINLDYLEAYGSRGWTKMQLKNYRRAVRDFDKAIKLDPDYAIAYFYRALSKLKLKRKSSACKDLSNAGELGHERAYDMIKKYCN